MDYFGTLIRYDELALKGRNRILFERQLISNIRAKSSSNLKVERLWGRILLEGEARLDQVFGISSYSPVMKVNADLSEIQETALKLLKDYLHSKKEKCPSFRIDVRRVDKDFSPNSLEIQKIIAGHILSHFPELKVDLRTPAIEIGVEIRREGAPPARAFLYVERNPGLRGLPVGSSAKTLALLSGGIDSPVASWLMMQRGAPVDFIHFYAYPYVGIQSKEKVIDLARHLGQYQNRSDLFVVSVTEIQEEIQKNCKDRFRTILLRRFMHRIAAKIAAQCGAKALITGESLGQVASQTLENIEAIQQATSTLILRPLIGFGKQKTIDLAKEIGTYDISIRPFDDCCALFQPKAPATKAKMALILREEEKLPVSLLVEKALETVETIRL
jgi:thiamine biosynthesis protein ThiI